MRGVARHGRTLQCMSGQLVRGGVVVLAVAILLTYI